jgi:fluoroquinolone transport system permease protein
MIRSLAGLDVLLAWRRGVIGAAAGAVAIYVLVLRLAPESIAETLLPFLVFSDPAALGFFFVGGIVLAERSEGTAAAIAVSPVPAASVLAARILVLATLGAVGGFGVALGSGLEVDWITFVPAVVLTALLYTCFGYAVAMRSSSVNDYFARATGWSTPLFAPLALFAVAPDAWFMALWPTTAALVLLRGDAGPGTAAVAIVVLALATAVVGRWALAALEAAQREGRG